MSVPVTSADAAAQSDLPLILGLSIPFGIIGAAALVLVMFLACYQIRLRRNSKVHN